MAYYSNKACKNCGKEDNDWRHARCGKCLEPLPGTDKPLKLEVVKEKKKKKEPWWMNFLPVMGGAVVLFLLGQSGNVPGAAGTPKPGTQVVSVQKKPQPAKPAPKARPPVAPKMPLPSRDVFAPSRVHGEVYVHDHFDGRFHAHGPFDPPHEEARKPASPRRVSTQPIQPTRPLHQRLRP